MIKQLDKNVHFPTLLLCSAKIIATSPLNVLTYIIIRWLASGDIEKLSPLIWPLIQLKRLLC